MSKLTEEQLSKLQGFVSSLNQAQSQLGNLEIQKHNLLHQTGEIQNALNEFQVELEKEYGKVSINIQDGTYKQIPEQDENS